MNQTSLHHNPLAFLDYVDEISPDTGKLLAEGYGGKDPRAQRQRRKDRPSPHPIMVSVSISLWLHINSGYTVSQI